MTVLIATRQVRAQMLLGRPRGQGFGAATSRSKHRCDLLGVNCDSNDVPAKAVVGGMFRESRRTRY